MGWGGGGSRTPAGTAVLCCAALGHQDSGQAPRHSGLLSLCPALLQLPAWRLRPLPGFAEQQAAHLCPGTLSYTNQQIHTCSTLLAGWALGVVTSRAFRTRGPSAPASALPLVDMANHSFSPNCKIAAAGSGDLQMVATRCVCRGWGGGEARGWGGRGIICVGGEELERGGGQMG